MEHLRVRSAEADLYWVLLVHKVVPLNLYISLRKGLAKLLLNLVHSLYKRLWRCKIYNKFSIGKRWRCNGAHKVVSGRGASYA